MRKPYRDFDLPTGHLSDETRYFVPLKARSAAEAERRRALPAGTLLAEQQYRGLLVATHMLAPLEADDQTEAAQIVANACLGSAYFSTARNAPRMRRRLKLPDMAHEDDDWRADHASALVATNEALAASINITGELVAQTAARDPRRFHAARQVGRCLGDAGLQLACLGWADMAINFSAFDAQEMARSEGLAAMDQTKRLGREIGVYPTLAQLAQPTSPLAVHIMNTAPNAVYEAFGQALGEHAIAS